MKRFLLSAILFLIGFALGIGVMVVFDKPGIPPPQLFSTYKTVTIGGTWNGVTFEVPSTWSVVRNPESLGTDRLPELPTGSVGVSDVSYNDLNWTQVDFFFVQNDIVESLTAKEEGFEETWTKETIGGVVADVLTIPLDDGQVTKAGTGGKEYVFRIPSSTPGGEKTLMILKQARGDEAFETGFAHLLKTFRFTAAR